MESAEIEQAWIAAPLGASRRPLMSHIMAAVVLHTGVSANDIKSRRKSDGVLRARNIVCYLARELTINSYPQIAELVCRDHTTVIHSVWRINQELAAGDDELREDIEEIRRTALVIAAQRRGR